MAVRLVGEAPATSRLTLDRRLHAALSAHHAANMDAVSVPQGLVVQETVDHRGKLTRVVITFRNGRGTKRSPERLNVLTPRQREVLTMIVDGISSRDIAGRLNRSVKTVEAHRAKIMKRLGVHNLAGLLRAALEQEARS
jgi:DNA-binding NarL/FixJ family response regulator